MPLKHPTSWLMRKSASIHTLCIAAVHNVGTNIRKHTVEYSDDDYHQVMSTNLESTYKLSQVLCGSFGSAQST